MTILHFVSRPPLDHGPPLVRRKSTIPRRSETILPEACDQNTRLHDFCDGLTYITCSISKSFRYYRHTKRGNPFHVLGRAQGARQTRQNSKRGYHHLDLSKVHVMLTSQSPRAQKCCRKLSAASTMDMQLDSVCPFGGRMCLSNFRAVGGLEGFTGFCQEFFGTLRIEDYVVF